MYRIGLILAFLAFSNSTSATDIKQVLIIVGPSNHPPGSHEVKAGARLMSHCLENSKNVSNVKATISYGWPKESQLNEADTVVFIGDAFPPNRLPGTEVLLAKLGAMMNRGCGIVCVHYATGLHANDVPKDGSHPLLNWMGGYSAFRCPHHNTIARVFPNAKITPATPKHPVSRGWKEFTIHDEPYINNYFSNNKNQFAKNVTPLAVSMLPPEKPKRETVSWCVEREDGGRGFGIVMPHFFRSWKNNHLRTFILNGIVWTTKREVPTNGVQCDLPPLKKFEPSALAP